MNVRQKRERDHEEMRQIILAAARDLFVREGYENTSIRRIAERIEYSAPAIYRYFASKEDIFFAIAETGFHLFHRSINAARPAADPLETLRRQFWRYYEFSKAQPAYFALMFLDRRVPRISQEWHRFEFMRATRDQMREVIRRAVEGEAFPAGTNPDVVFHILATVVHGAAVIRLSDRFVPPRAADALARDAFEATLQGLRHGVTTTFDVASSFHSQHAPLAAVADGGAPLQRGHDASGRVRRAKRAGRSSPAQDPRPKA
jgi:AcrR family transcriptional regulator